MIIVSAKGATFLQLLRADRAEEQAWLEAAQRKVREAQTMIDRAYANLDPELEAHGRKLLAEAESEVALVQEVIRSTERDIERIPHQRPAAD